MNSSQNIEHQQLTDRIICDTNGDLLIYLLNGENIGTDDDRKHLLFVLEKYHGNILFAHIVSDWHRAKALLFDRGQELFLHGFPLNGAPPRLSIRRIMCVRYRPVDGDVQIYKSHVFRFFYTI